MTILLPAYVVRWEGTGARSLSVGGTPSQDIRYPPSKDSTGQGYPQPGEGYPPPPQRTEDRTGVPSLDTKGSAATPRGGRTFFLTSFFCALQILKTLLKEQSLSVEAA